MGPRSAPLRRAGACSPALSTRRRQGVRVRHPASASRPEARSASADRAQPGASRSSQGIRQDRRSQVPSLDTLADAALQRSTRRLGANQSRAPTQGRAPRKHRPGVRIHISHFEQIAKWKIRPAARGRDRWMGSGTCGSSSWLLNQATAESLGRRKWSLRLTPGRSPALERKNREWKLQAVTPRVRGRIEARSLPSSRPWGPGAEHHAAAGDCRASMPHRLDETEVTLREERAVLSRLRARANATAPKGTTT